jgi:hypothetical protein
MIEPDHRLRWRGKGDASHDVFTEEDCRKLLGGNALRVVESALGGA